MSAIPTVRAPEGMSCVNALHALIKNAEEADIFVWKPHLLAIRSKEVASAEKISEIFKTKAYFDHEGGRKLKVDVSAFPELRIDLYVSIFGEGVIGAEKALADYNNISSARRLDAGDSADFYMLNGAFKYGQPAKY